MRIRNRLAAARIVRIAAGVTAIATAVACWSPFWNIKARYDRIESFSGTSWISDANANRAWSGIVDRLNTLAKAVPPTGDDAVLDTSLDNEWQKPGKGPPTVVPVESFRLAHDKAHVAKWRGTRYRSGKPSYDVNYGFAVMTRSQKNLDKTYLQDRVVMLRVMKEVVGWFDETHDGAPELYARGLAEALKLDFSDHSEDMGINSVYIGSSNGNAAFFPANNFQLAPKKTMRGKTRYYDPRLRPWYEAATGISLETEKSDECGLSYQYLDYSDKVSLVRTAWKTVELGDVTYVVAIDIMLHGDDLFKQTSTMGNVRVEVFEMAKSALWNAFVSWGLPLSAPLLLLALFVLLGGFRTLRDRLAVGRRLKPTNSYEFRRLDRPRYWHMDNGTTRTETDVQSSRRQDSRATSAEAGFSGANGGLMGAFRRTWTRSESEASEKRTERSRKVIVAPTNVTERCVEEWTLVEVKSEQRRCRHCQQTARAIIGERSIADMIATHRDHDQVDVAVERWDRPKTTFVHKQAAQQALAKHCAVGGEPSGGFSLVESSEEANPIPPQVKALDQIDKHLAAKAQIDGGRIGYRDGVSIGFPLYHGVSVEAVCDPWYLDQVLRQKETEILASGTRLRRILFVKSELDIQQLLDDHGQVFVDLVARSSKRLWYVIQEDLPEPFSGFNKWDFAVLEYGSDKALVMISDTTQFHHLNANQASQGVTGELTWRRADVEFYHALFEIMYCHKRDLMEIVSELVGQKPLRVSAPRYRGFAPRSEKADENVAQNA